MRKCFRFSILSLAMIFLVACITACGSSKDDKDTSTEAVKPTESEEEVYPSHNISAILPWGSDGDTDSLMRPLAKLAENELGQTIIVENKVGANGSEAAKYVYNQNADGYTLLMGTESPQLYKALGLMDLSYDDFEPIILVGDEVAGIAVRKNSPYHSLKKLVQAAKFNPGSIKIATTGAGGLSWEAASMLITVTSANFQQISYKSEAEAQKAVLDGECDLTICKGHSVVADKEESLVFLSMISDQKVENFENVPLIINEYEDFKDFLPWGPFTGVFVRKDTDPQIIEQLRAAFYTAYNNPEYQQILKDKNINGLGISGEEAETYLSKWRIKTLKALVKSGQIDKNFNDLLLK